MKPIGFKVNPLYEGWNIITPKRSIYNLDTAKFCEGYFFKQELSRITNLRELETAVKVKLGGSISLD